MNAPVRRKAEPSDPAAPKSSAECRDDLDRHDADLAAAVGELDRLRSGRNAVLLTGDAAERHDAEMAKLGRVIERSDLRRPRLVPPIAMAERREEAERKANQKAQAIVAVEAVMAKMEAGYSEPAAAIADFLTERREATSLARAAGVPSPEAILRFTPGQTIPADDEEYEVWLDPDGIEQRQNPPPTVSVIDRRTGKMVAEKSGERGWLARWRKETRTRPGKERYIPGVNLSPLAEAVSLPGLRVGDPRIW